MSLARIAVNLNTPGSNQYWLIQFFGWTGMAIISYLSLTIWYNPGQLTPAVHTFLQSYLGMIVSHPLAWIASRVWEAPLPRRVIWNSLALLLASIIWTILRLITFTWLTGEAIGSSDWGGWIFASITVMGAWLFCYYAIRYYRQWVEERQVATDAQRKLFEAQALAQLETMRRLEAESHFKDTQLRILQYQLNPHFLFNALNSVVALVQRGSNDDATTMLNRIADFLRATLDQRDELIHPLRDEIDLVQLYLNIEKVRFQERLATEFHIDPEAEQIDVPAFILQPIFENSIKYGVGRQLSRTTVRLYATVTGKVMRIVVSDDGPGQQPSDAAPSVRSMGIGLENVQKRLESSYGHEFEFTAGHQPAGGYEVSLVIPATLRHR